jgi:hypothetical protein
MRTALVVPLWVDADQRFDHLTVLEHQHGRDCTNAEIGWYFWVLVNVQLSDLDAFFKLAGKLFDRGHHHMARSAPRSPEVDQHRPVAVENLAFKTRVSKFKFVLHSLLLWFN